MKQIFRIGMAVWTMLFACDAAFADAFQVTPSVQHPAKDAMSLIWFTDSACEATVKWSPEAGGAEQQAKTTGVLAQALTNNVYTGESAVTPKYRHRVRLTGLTAGTRYNYSVTLPGGMSYANTFKTAPDANSPIRFMYFNDSETKPNNPNTSDWADPNNNDRTRTYYISPTEGYKQGLARMKSRNPDLFVMAGDLAWQGGYQTHWDEFWRHNAGGAGIGFDDPAGSIPILAAIGNHDLQDVAARPAKAVGMPSSCENYLGGESALERYLTYFEYEPNGVDFSDIDNRDRSQMFHRVDYGPVTLIFLDTNNGDDSDFERDTNTGLFRDPATAASFGLPAARSADFNPGSKQYTWLTNQLADAQQKSKFTFVVNHQCPYSSGYHNRKNITESGEWLSGRALRILNATMLKYGVDGWLCGHDEMMEHARIEGEEVLPDGTTRPHHVDIYDMGTIGNGLRGGFISNEGKTLVKTQRVYEDGTKEIFRAYVDEPEVVQNGVLVAGGVHYTHMEVNVEQPEPGLWTCTMTPNYYFTSNYNGRVGSEWRTYNDVVVLTNDLRAAKPPAVEPLVFFDFAEGVDGQSVGGVPNAGSAGGLYDGTATADPAGAVLYSDDVPAKYLFTDETQTEIITADWKSIEFRTDEETHGKGGIVTIPGLGAKLGELGASGEDFTIEFFAKFAFNQAWKDFLKFFFQSAGSSNQQAKYVVWMDNHFSLQMSGDNPTPSATSEPNVWYHLAAVYTKADATWRMYRNGILYATQVGEILGPGTSPNLTLGGQTPTYEAFSGKLAALRVTAGALAPERFLHASSFDVEKQKEYGGALGFWGFEEGVAGEDATEVPNVIDPSDKLVGAALGTGGTMPVYSDDVPGTRIRASSTDATLLAKNAKSVKFAGNAENNAGGRLTFPDLRTRLAKAGAFTLEYFCKIDELNAWRNFFVLRFNSAKYAKMCNRVGATQLCTQYSGGAGDEKFVDTAYTLLGNWHHVALEWDAESRKLTTFVDYVQATEFEDVPLEDTPQPGYFGCNVWGTQSEVLNGKIFGVRLMPRRLAPEEMMVVDTPSANVAAYDDHTVFHWGFEELGATEGGELGVVDAAPRNLPPLRGAASRSGGASVPTYSTDVCQPHRKSTVSGRVDPATLLPNRFSAYFWGYSATYDNSWAGSHLETLKPQAGIETCPESFTFEMFVKRDMGEGCKPDGVNGQLLAGYGAAGIDTQMAYTDWTVTFDPYGTHNLRLQFYDRNNAISVQKNSGISLDDGAWHHFALTYDAESKMFTMFLDYAPRFEMEAPNGLRRTAGWRHAVGRGFNTSGFNGWMDDIRLSDVVRSPDEFLRKGDCPQATYLYIR